ncbi:MAG: hypothetical protein EB015_22995 [Methylocystaceae bacterium]|nr:hypothetical protein [Methylocystaceae bacterium]
MDLKLDKEPKALTSLPVHIHLKHYPALKKLAWQLKDDADLTPKEALNIYERNWRHIDEAALEPHEKKLIDNLRSDIKQSL